MFDWSVDMRIMSYHVGLVSRLAEEYVITCLTGQQTRRLCHNMLGWSADLLMRTIASFLRYTGYLNFINGPISHVLLLILVHVQLLSCLFF